MIAYQTVTLAKAIIIIFEHQTVISLKQCRRVHTYICVMLAFTIVYFLTQVISVYQKKGMLLCKRYVCRGRLMSMVKTNNYAIYQI